MATVADDLLRLRDSAIGWPLEEMWVTGAMLDPGDDVDHASVVLMLDLPSEQLPWLAVDPTAEWVSEQLRLGKRPVQWCYRPLAWPPWTYQHRPVVRCW